jgi:hypothetical protein
MIQDLIFSLGGIIFMVALIPSLVSENKPNYKTSILTSIVLYTFSITYISLDLTYSSIVSFITATLWLILFYQSRQNYLLDQAWIKFSNKNKINE